MTITITHPQTRSHRTRGVLVAVLLAVVVTLATLVAVRALTDGDSSPASTRASVADVTSFGETVDTADWARSEGLSGLSPASVGSVVERSEPSSVAEWAEAEGASGLSPASLSGGG